MHGAFPTRAQDASRTNPATGAEPRLSAEDRARSQQFLKLFVAQMNASMSSALDGLYSDDEDADESGDGQDDMFGGLDQAQIGALGGGSALAGAGAGNEAALAQQLLAALSGSAAPQSGVGAAANVAASASAPENAATVAEVARKVGVDPATAVAMMLVESGGNAGSVGDGGTSFGLFQLHEGGMLTAAGLTPQEAFDPATNAKVALTSLAHEWAKDPNRSPGEIAAASQRPADQAGYARKVNAALAQARSLLS